MDLAILGACLIGGKLLTACDPDGRKHFSETHSKVMLVVGAVALVVGVVAVVMGS